MECVFAAIKDRLNLILCGTANEKLIKVAKGKVIETLHKLSNSEIYAEHVRKLKQRHQQLCEFVRRTDRILSRILEKREITEKEFELIYSQPTDYETVHLLINKLCDKPVSAYLVFLDALRNTGQQHVVALLEEKDYELNSDHKTALLDNYTYLKANISVSHTSLLDHLLAAEVLDVHEVEKIRSKDTNDEQVHQLLHYIMRTSYDQYQRFLEALNNAEHNFVYNTLKEVSINKIGREESELDLTTLDLNQGTADLTKVNRKQAILDTAKDDQEKRRLVATSVYLEPDNLDLANADRKQVTLDRVNDERESNGLNLSEVSRGHLNSVIAALRKVGELAISPAPILGLVPGLASFMAPKNDSRQDVIQSVPFHRELDGTDLNLRQSSEIEIDLTMFRKTASMAHFVPRNEKEYSGGITVINNQVFVARGASLVEVYKSIDFSFSHNLTITGSREIQALASCTRYNCLYLGDAGQPTIHRYDFLNKQTTNWSSSGMCRGLSITKDSSVLVTFFDTKRILEYTTRGILIREIILDSSSRVPRHCVQLSTENFVVCYPGLLGIVDRAGRVIQSYATSENLRRYSPCHVVFDQRDNILVADCSNDRVQLFSPSLTYIGDVEMPEAELKEPESLHFDELNLRLYIKESWAVTGRIFVLNIND